MHYKRAALPVPPKADFTLERSLLRMNLQMAQQPDITSCTCHFRIYITLTR